MNSTRCQNRLDIVRIHWNSDEVELIGATTTQHGLRVHAELDPRAYPTKVKVPDHEFAEIPLTRHEFHGEWNYTITPQPPQGSA